MLIPVIIAVSFIVYALMDLIPGDMMSGFDLTDYTEAEIASLRASLGIDDPLLVKYGRYMLNLIQGDLGKSDLTGFSVWEQFISRLPNTLLLALCSFIIGVSIAIPMGVHAARNSGKLADNITTTIAMIGMSMPGFWLGILLILLFSYSLGWFPTGGNQAGLRSVVLPAIAASMGLIASATRQTRSSMLEVLKADYLRTARAKGVPERVVIRKHALGNALIPIVTSVGLVMGGALAGSAVIESVFAWPGVGRLVVEAVFARDATATTGTVILTTIVYCIVQLLVDMVYAFVDPRIKAQYVRIGKTSKRTKKSTVLRTAPKLQPVAEAIVMQVADTSSGQNEAASGQIDIPIPIRDIEPAQSIVADYVTDVDETLAKFEEKQEETRRSAPESSEALTRKYRKRSQVGDVFHHMRQNRGAVTGMILISIMFLFFIASLFVPYETITIGIARDRLSPPSSKYFFGTDGMGRDLFMRVLYASRFSLPIGVGATLVAAIIGITLGSNAAYYGGKVDDIIMRISDTFASIPGIITGMVIVSALGQSLQNLIIAVGVSAIPTFIRTSRASTLSVRGNEYVEASRAVGLSDTRTIFTHVLPNAMAPIMITFSITLGTAILISASLSFLGFGIPLPYPEWGSLVSTGRDTIRTAPWLTAFPGAMIMLTVMGFNLLGDGLRDALDPKLKK